MIEPVSTRLLLVPWNVYVDAQIISLTAEMAESQIRHDWWNDDCLKSHPIPPPIDRHWNWNELSIEYESRSLPYERVAIVAGTDNAIQGALMVSSEPVKSILESGNALFVELLFTAPRNRIDLRKDGKHLLRGVGVKLLTWAAQYSREKGCNGRLLLDSSPDQIDWYEKRGLQTLERDPIIYESVEYTPMELPAKAADELLKTWKTV